MSPSSDRMCPLDGIIKSPPRKTQRRGPSARHGVTFLISESTIQDAFSPAVRLSDDEIVSLWYTEEEYCLMKKSISFTVKLMERNQTSMYDDDEVCPRGLEGHTRNGSIRKSQNVEGAVDSVLIEQERQWETNVVDDVALARLYRSVCAQCTMEAWLVAQKDAKAARPVEDDILDGNGAQIASIPAPTPRMAPFKRQGGEAVPVRGAPFVPFDTERNRRVECS